MVAGVVGFECAERELAGAPAERVGAEGVGHADEVSGDAGEGPAVNRWLGVVKGGYRYCMIGIGGRLR